MPVRDYQFDSSSLGEPRVVTVFLPPGYRPPAQYPCVFCADGQAVHGFSQRLSLAIEQEGVPPVIVVGVHSTSAYRAKEYIDGVAPKRFESHERFFVEEAYDWGAEAFSIRQSRESCAVFGVSNGGAFALSMGVRHREKYGVVIAFSIAGGLAQIDESEYAKRPIGRYYISSGTREKPFRRTGRMLAKLLEKHGVEHCTTERCAGHEFDFWASEFPEAIRWAFSSSETVT